MPVDRGIIEQQLMALGESSDWWDQRELRDLPAALHGDEQILGLARGKLARLRWLRRSWLIVVTNRRVLCLQSSSRMSRRQMEVPIDQITRVTLRVGVFRGKLLVQTSADRYRMLMKRSEAYKLLGVLSTLVQPRGGALPGFSPTGAVTRMVQHVLDLPTVALQPVQPPKPAPPPVNQIDAEIVDRRLQLLEDQVQRLQQQVDFLEDLLQQRDSALLPTRSGRS